MGDKALEQQESALTTTKLQLLVVDDSNQIRNSIVNAVNNAGYDCQEAPNGYEALSLLEKTEFDAVTLDLEMPGLNGIDLLRIIRERWPDMIVVMITSVTEINSALTAMRIGAFDYLTKPFSDETLRITLNRAITQSRLRKENEELLSKLKKANKNLKLNQLKIQNDLELAHEIQQSLLPEFVPHPDLYDISAANFPARSVGGDLFNFKKFRYPENSIGIFIGDVSGKGVPAALIMAMSNAEFEFACTQQPSPKKVMERMNKNLCQKLERIQGRFITAFYAIMDCDTKELVFANAGHNYPFLIRESGRIERLDTEGMILGVDESIKFEEISKDFYPGDKLVLYTDGIIEAKNASGELLGEDRFCNILLENREKSSQEILKTVKSYIDDFAQGVPQHDDITMVIASILPR
jgi:phosphoserine phosphatase RsbU/P